jgi:hypothetical protein
MPRRARIAGLTIRRSSSVHTTASRGKSNRHGKGRSAAHYAPVVYLYAIVAPLFTRMLIYSP